MVIRDAQDAVRVFFATGREEDEEGGVVCDFRVEDGGCGWEREGGDVVAVEVAREGGYAGEVGEVVDL